MLKAARFIVLVFFSLNCFAIDNPEWFGSNIFAGKSAPPKGLPASNEAPKFDGIDSKVIQLKTDNSWQSTGVSAEAGKAITFEWDKQNIIITPVRYAVLYRLDYRFDKQPMIVYQTYKSQYNSNDAKSTNQSLGEEDYKNYQKQDLSTHFSDTNEQKKLNRVNLLNDYFSMTNRGIWVNAGDVINILLATTQYFHEIPDSPNGSNINLYDIDTRLSIGLQDNKILNISADEFCKANVGLCSLDSSGQYVYNIKDPLYNVFGGFFNSLSTQLGSLQSCPDNNKTNYCLQDKGRGMKISVGDQVIKDENVSFLPGSGDSAGKYIYTYIAPVSGQLSITTTPKINSNAALKTSSFVGYDPKLSSMIENGKTDPDYYSSLTQMTGLQSGRYIMEITVGSSGASVQSALQNMQYEYSISQQKPPEGSSGTSISEANNRSDASSKGPVWVRNSNKQNLIESIPVKCSAYTGSQDLSKGIMTYIVGPIKRGYSGGMETMYNGLTKNRELQGIIYLIAVLYILIYAMYFLLGVVQVTASDLLIRITKVIIVVNVLLSEGSWEFFNQYVFDMLINGTDELIQIFSGNPSSADNPFGFLDPVFNMYISSEFWISLLAQLVQFWNGIGLLAILLLIGVFLFFGSLLEIVITYIMSFIVVYILIGLAPIFIPLMLFSRTNGFFINWIMIIFKNMLMPAILIALILIFNQFIDNILKTAILGNKWGCLIDLAPVLNVAGMNLAFPKGVFCIPFYVPTLDLYQNFDEAAVYVASNATNVAMASFMYFTYSLVIQKLLSFTNTLVGRITGVVSENAALTSVNRVKSSSLGRTINALSGADIANRYIQKRSPFSYEDKMGELESKVGKTVGSAAWNTGKAAWKFAKDPKKGYEETKEALGNKWNAVKSGAKEAGQYVKREGFKTPFKLAGKVAAMPFKAAYSAIKFTGKSVINAPVRGAQSVGRKLLSTYNYIKGDPK
jgi:type IV secretion system protein VirB6